LKWREDEWNERERGRAGGGGEGGKRPREIDEREGWKDEGQMLLEM